MSREIERYMCWNDEFVKHLGEAETGILRRLVADADETRLVSFSSFPSRRSEPTKSCENPYRHCLYWEKHTDQSLCPQEKGRKLKLSEERYADFHRATPLHSGIAQRSRRWHHKTSEVGSRRRSGAERIHFLTVW